MERHFLRKSQRIVSDEEFRRILSYKCFVCKGILRLYAAPNTVGKPRFGVSIGRTCGDAVRRNRLKRLGREVFRLCQHQIPAGYDYILIFTRKVPKTNTKDHLSNIDDDTQSLRFKDIKSRFLAMAAMLSKKGRLNESE